MVVLMGRFGAPHGVRGEIRVTSFASDPLALFEYDGLRLRDGRKIAVTHARFVKDNICVARLEGITKREAAQALTGQDIYIARTALPQTDEDEFYLTDLIGLEARDAAGQKIGAVRDVVNYGAGDILDVMLTQGGAQLVAFTRANVPHINVAAGYITLCLPDEIEGEPLQGDG